MSDQISDVLRFRGFACQEFQIAPYGGGYRLTWPGGFAWLDERVAGALLERLRTERRFQLIERVMLEIERGDFDFDAQPPASVPCAPAGTPPWKIIEGQYAEGPLVLEDVDGLRIGIHGALERLNSQQEPRVPIDLLLEWYERCKVEAIQGMPALHLWEWIEKNRSALLLGCARAEQAGMKT